MGSGKSTAGQKLAAMLKVNFIDLDAYIEKKEKADIPTIFEQKGEAGFRTIESDCLDEILRLNKASVISLGGGTVCFHSNLEKIKEKGLLIYIQLTPVVLAERIRKSKTTRPLLKNLSEEELLKNIEEILSERGKYYTQAQITVNGLNLSPQLLNQKIIGLLQENIH